MKQKIKLSQCMIVKNEEKNIRHALSWSKNIVYEQIVVDTGSTDRTVELARELGAKVFHFKWIDDFSAAKNFAIEQASGNYVAFLDADEYFTESDANKLYDILSDLENQPQYKGRSLILQSAWLHLDDQGNVFTRSVQNRVFSNTRNIRYINKIHETLHSTGSKPSIIIDTTNTLSIYHTGYSNSSYRETKKAERNIAMLKQQLETEPENLDAWSYLGESYLADHKYDEAEEAFRKVISTPGKKIMKDRQTMSYFDLLRIISIKDMPNAQELLEDIYEKAQKADVRSADIDYIVAFWMHRHGKYEETVLYLERALKELENHDKQISLMISSELDIACGMLSYTYMQLGNKPMAVKYAALTLKQNRFMDAALETILALFKNEPGQSRDPSDTFHFLEKLYRFNELKDKLYVMKAAKKTGFQSIYNLLFELMSDEEKKWMLAKKVSPYRLNSEQASEKYPGIPFCNETDAAFLELAEEINDKSEHVLLEMLIENLEGLKTKHLSDYNNFVDFFARYPFWGQLDPEKKQFNVLEDRVKVLKEHLGDFLWLYKSLEDNRSRKSLFAILDNWLHLNRTHLECVKENGIPYYDTDIIPTGSDKVFVDAGAYTGDSTLDFIRTYGEDYKKVYCYEITPISLERLKDSTRGYANIIIRDKAVYSSRDTLYLSENNDIAANRAAKTGSTEIEAVSMDEDIKETVSFIKMDIEGLEFEALTGCRQHIEKEHPALAIAIYHGYEEIWKIPRMISEMDPSYRFYLRYYGGNLIPAEFVLYAV